MEGGGGVCTDAGAGVGAAETVVVQVPLVTPRTFPGPSCAQNKGAIDWAGHGLLAYGSNYTVVILDTTNVQIVQCLDRHKSVVKKVLWGRDYLNQDKPSAPRVCGSVDLVSADATGHIVVWDVFRGKPLYVFNDGNKPIQQLAWVNDWYGKNNVLAALHPPYAIVLWDTKGNKLWKKTYTETLLSFCFDPFHPSKMAFHCTDCILFVDDFNIARIPSSNGRKFYVSTPRSKNDEKFALRRIVKDMVIGESKPKHEDGALVSECLDVSYHRSLRHHVLLLYARELLVLDLHINHTVAIISLGDKSASPFLQTISCKQRDVIYCLHDSGSVSVKLRKRPSAASVSCTTSVSSLDLSSDSGMELMYEQKCSSESMRQTRGLQVLGMAVNPVCERRLAVYLNSGKIVILELSPLDDANGNNHVTIDKDGIPISDCIRDTLNEIIPPLFSDWAETLPSLKIFVTGLLPSIVAPLSAMRMCPALTSRNWQTYTPLLAGGTVGGLIQVFNLASGEIEREFVIHSYTVRGIEWTDLKSFLSYAFPSSNSSVVRNELCLTDVQTGESLSLRTDRGEEPPIDIVRVSSQRQYFILVLSGGPVELWDLKAKHLLRVLPKKFPIIIALEWSPARNTKSLKRRQSSKEDCLLDATGGPPPLERIESTNKIILKEHFVFSDSESQLYYFTVDGHQLKDGTRIPPESGGAAITAIAFKADLIVQGDSDGLLSVWDLRLQQARRQSTSRGYIKRMRFAPGKGNFKLLILYNDGVDIIDLKSNLFERCAQLRCPRDMVKVLDIDWGRSDRPVLATVDGCIRIMDENLSSSYSTILDYEFVAPVYCPALLPQEAAFKLRERLCWQPADAPYTLNLTEEHGFTAAQLLRVHETLAMANPALISSLRAPSYGTAQRSLLVARLFGDFTEIDFWTIALYFLQASHAALTKEVNPLEEPRTDSPAISETSLDCHKINLNPELEPLDTCYDVLQDSFTYQKLQLERVTLHESRRGDYDHTKRVIQELLLLGQSDRAVQLLLETDLNNPNYYTDAIKACLVATVRNTGASQSTVKLVATNLIASGSTWDGVQLLCLIGKGLDACRYLESYGHWGAATWLARAVLTEAEATEIIRKWADCLSSQGHKEKAILVLMSLQQWAAAYSLLSEIDPRRAALLAHALQDFSLSPVS